MKTLNNSIPILLIIMMVLVISSVSYASTITNAGFDLTTLADWRTTTTAKALDVDGDNIYGTDGYYVIYSGYNQFYSKTPDYISSILDPTGSRHTNGAPYGYEAIDSVDNLPGPSVSDAVTGIFMGGGEWPNLMRFTLQTDASFRLGIISDVTDAHVSPTAFNLAHDGAATNVTIGTATRNSTADYYFYDVSGNAGDVFNLTAENDLAHPSNGIAGVFFDSNPVVVPEPISSTLFIIGGATLGLRRFRKNFKK